MAVLLGVAGPARADRLIVGFDRTGVAAGERADVLDDADATRVDTIVAAPTLAVETATAQPGAALDQVKRDLGADNRVAWVAEDSTVSTNAFYTCSFHPDLPTFEPTTYDDPRGCLQWYMRPGDQPDAGIAEAWPRILSAQPVTVGVIDTGIDLEHPDLAGQLWTNPQDGTHGFNVVTSTNDPADDRDGHGTEVAGVIAAAADNGVGVAGACPTCRILPVAVFDFFPDGREPGARDSNVLKGIAVAIEHGAQVINLSLGRQSPGYAPYTSLFRAYPSVTFVLAAGNDNASNDEHPYTPCGASAQVANAICVAASDVDDDRASFSNWGSGVAVAAPGMGIYTTALVGDDDYSSGTSLAAPLVSAAAAVLRGHGASARQSVQAIVQGADTPPLLADDAPSRRLSFAGALAAFDGMPYDVDPPAPPPPPPPPPPPGGGGGSDQSGGPPPPNTAPKVDKPKPDPRKDPRKLKASTPRWSRQQLSVPTRCTAACTLTVRVYNGKHRLLVAKVALKKAGTKTLTVRMSKTAYKRIRRLTVRVDGSGSATHTLKPARAC